MRWQVLLKSIYKFYYYKFIIAYVISLILWFVLTLHYLNIEPTEELVYFGMTYGLLTTLYFLGFTKKKFHNGHLPVIIGFNIMLITGGLLAGNIGWEQYGKEQWWFIPSMEHKAILLIALIAGTGVFIFGVAANLGNWMWWGRGGKGFGG